MKWLKEYIDYKKMSILSFEKSIGSRSTIDKAIKSNSNLRGDILSKIIVTYKDINPKWLLTGEGEMLLKSKAKEYNESDVLELINTLLERKDELLQNETYRNYIRATMELIMADDERDKKNKVLEELREIALKKHMKKS